MVHSLDEPQDPATIDRTSLQGTEALRAHDSAPRTAALGPALRVDVVDTVAGVADLRAEYAELQAATGNTLPFALFEWHNAWCRHFPRTGAVTRDRPLFHVMREIDGSCAGIVPLILTTRHLGTLRYSSVGLLGADPAITEIQAPLVRPGAELRVAAALDLSLRRRSHWDLIQWSGPPDRFAAELGARRELDWRPAPPSYVLDLPSTWETFRTGLKRNIRESLRHGYNSLKRDGHAFAFSAATAPAAVRDALDRLFELHAMRAAVTDTTVHPNRFAGLPIRDFMHEVCAELAARGVVRVFQLEIGGQVVAARLGFVVGGGLYLYYSGFDPAWSRYGVMTTTVAEALKYAIDLGIKTVNLSPGTDVSKTRWGPREVPQQTAVEHGSHLRARLVRLAYVRAKSGKGLEGFLLKRLLPGRRSWR